MSDDRDYIRPQWRSHPHWRFEWGRVFDGVLESIGLVALPLYLAVVVGAVLLYVLG